MLANKAQAMVVDLILLVVITSIFFIFMSQQSSNQGIDAGIIKSQNFYTDKLLNAVLNQEIKDSTFKNAKVSELIGALHCDMGGTYPTINKTINEMLLNVSKQNHYFILSSVSKDANTSYIASCSPYIESNFGCCVNIEKMTTSTIELDLPCNNSKATISLGVWPKSMEVQPC